MCICVRVCVCVSTCNLEKFNLLSGSIKNEIFVITSAPGTNLKEKGHGNKMGKNCQNQS